MGEGAARGARACQSTDLVVVERVVRAVHARAQPHGRFGLARVREQRGARGARGVFRLGDLALALALSLIHI